MTEHHTGIPAFAIVGHPNEGKSSVVSTLAEDDSVVISPFPGETKQCRNFPVMIDGQEIIRFIDTPGFQNPNLTLAWFRDYAGPDREILHHFLKAHESDPDFDHECELFRPIEQGAGIIYVIDSSQPLRSHDKAEMEILRLTGQPRMAIINPKEVPNQYLEQWKSELRKHFNSVRIFNAHQATYTERLDLLSTLRGIDQDWEPAIDRVISSFKQDWDNRSSECARIIAELLSTCLTHTEVKNYAAPHLEKETAEIAVEAYQTYIRKMESRAHERMRRLFKHNILRYSMPETSIVDENLFSNRTWQLLGLTQKQLAAAAGVSGGAIGAALDLAAHGLSFGVFTAIGGLLGAGSALLGGQRLIDKKVIGMKLGGYQVKIGPCRNIQFLYVLLDRALIFYSAVINWAHGRREGSEKLIERAVAEKKKIGFAGDLDSQTRKSCEKFFKALSGRDRGADEAARLQFIQNVKKNLELLSSKKTPFQV